MIKMRAQNCRVAIRQRLAGFALWNLGFRPFYLLASIFAALSILLWICQYTGHLPAAYLRESGLARPRNAVRLHAGRGGGVSLHCRSHLDRQADADRCGADGACGALGRRPRAGPDALTRPPRRS